MNLRKLKIIHKTTDNGQPASRQGGLTTDKIVDILLVNRGLKTKKEREEFLNPKIENVNLENVEISKNAVRKTIKRINEAVRKNEKIIIYGDYDVDGICGTAILWEAIYKSYKNVLPYIPHRVDEGYGLSIAGIDHLLASNKSVKLIITVDNGIVANDAVAYANKNGIDVIISDHHVESKKLPGAYSIIHTTKLCGAGVAYLLAKELTKIHNSKFIIHNSLELVALATVADLVPLTGANRILVKFGIESLKTTKRPGLLALLAEAATRAEEIDVYKIGHVIAPRLNASGRIAHAMDSLRLICTKDKIRAQKLARHLGATNRERQLLTEESTLNADSLTVDLTSERLIFIDSKDYNPGIIGLVASRLVEKYYLPSVVVSVGEKYSKGSARSVKGLNIIEFIRTFQHLLVDAGGHPMAAGFTLETSRIEELKALMLAHAAKIISADILERVLSVDLEINFNQIAVELYSKMHDLAPYGVGNPEPLFISRKVKIEGLRLVGRDNKHVKLQISQNGKSFDAIFFGGGDQNIMAADLVDIVYGIDQNEWKGNLRIELKIKDLIKVKTK